MKLIQISPNFHKVSIGPLQVWFSYETPIAFNACDGKGTIAHQNDWSTTTEKHMNAIDRGNKAGRISGEAFEEKLKTLENWVKKGYELV